VLPIGISISAHGLLIVVIVTSLGIAMPVFIISQGLLGEYKLIVVVMLGYITPLTHISISTIGKALTLLA
jgi:hypothetical protein